MESDSSLAEPLPVQFEASSTVLPLTKHGVFTFHDFRKAEDSLKLKEWLKRIGLSEDEIELYSANEAGRVELRPIESSVLKARLQNIYQRISGRSATAVSTSEEEPSTSTSLLDRTLIVPIHGLYPEGHPMNDIKDLEQKLLSHLESQEPIIMPSINKRRKLLRRLQRKEEKLLDGEKHEPYPTAPISEGGRPGSLWDVKEIPQNKINLKNEEKQCTGKTEKIVGPKKLTMYTVKDNKIVRLEPVAKGDANCDNYQAINIVIPVNTAEEQLLEGTKMCVDDIKKIERFKDYEPGYPSKVLYLKNIAPGVSQEQLQLLFLQFVQDNGGPIDLRLMTGRMRGQAFVAFQNEDVAIRALEEVNGTIVAGRPIIVQFGRQSNRIQEEGN